MSGATEQRRSTRRPVDLFVEETLGERTWLHPAVDLSVHGLYILAHDDRRAVDGERDLELSFGLPDGSTITTRGRVVHVDDHRGRRGLRVAFVDMDEAQHDAIRDYLDTLSDEEPLAQAG